MFTWFHGVFSSTSDKSRLIAIVISSIVALSLLLLNQHFQNRRKRKELLLTKTEELYNAINSYGAFWGETFAMHASRSLSKTPTPNGECQPFLSDDYQTELALSKKNGEMVLMLIALYFSKEFPCISELRINKLQALSQLQKHGKNNHSVVQLDGANWDYLNADVGAIKKLCYKLAKKYSY